MSASTSHTPSQAPGSPGADSNDAPKRSAGPPFQNSIRVIAKPRNKPDVPELTEEPRLRDRKAANRGKSSATVPDEIRKRFVQIGRKFYFPDGDPAFEDRGKRLITRSENTELIRNLLAIAQERGWQHIQVDGTDRFRKEAWMQARLAGLTVRGYVPNEIEQALLVRKLARQQQVQPEPQQQSSSQSQQRSRRPAHQQAHQQTQQRSQPDLQSSAQPHSQSPADRRLERSAEQLKTTTTAPSAQRGAARSVAGRDTTSAHESRSTDSTTRGKLITGRLLEYGPAPYNHDRNEPMSFYVKIEAAQGERDIWGVDLERALRESLSRPQIGDQVGLRSLHHDPVTVPVHERDREGNIIETREVRKHRNRWILERRDFLDTRAQAARTLRDDTIDPRRAVQKHPELAGTYLQLHAAELAARKIPHPDDQRRFIATVRRSLAASVARGEPLQPVRIREHALTATPQQQVPNARRRDSERELAPSR